jgi:hypothetical protein
MKYFLYLDGDLFFSLHIFKYCNIFGGFSPFGWGFGFLGFFLGGGAEVRFSHKD